MALRIKHKLRSGISALMLLGAGVLLSACGSSGSSSTDNSVAISIPFKAVAGSEPIRCGETISGLGLVGTDVKVADFRMFVHDVKLITDQNIEIPVKLDASQASQNAEVVLLDFRDTAEDITICAENNTNNTVDNPGYNTRVIGRVTVDPAYTISHIQFNIGVPFALNHANQANAVEPLRNPGSATGMHWNWQIGYKFTAFDMLPVGGVSRPSDEGWSSPKWNIHLGSTGCAVGVSDLNNGVSPEACSAPNLTTVTLALGEYNWEDAAIELDYADLIDASNLSQDSANAPGCMSGSIDPECEGVFEKFGLPWGDNTAVEQTVFSIVANTEV